MKPVKDRIPTLVFYASGEAHWRRVTIVTGLHLLHALPGGKRARSWPYIRRRRSLEEEFRVLSYMVDWREAFCRAPALAVDTVDINDLVAFCASLRRLDEYALVVVLHSAAWDAMKLLRFTMRRFPKRRGKLLVLFGDEYFHMPEKLAFAHGAEADYIGSQLPLAAAEWLYADCAARVLPAPHALNPDVFMPRPGPRPIEIGFRGAMYASLFLGDGHRNEVLQMVQERARARGVKTDLQDRRVPRDQWAEFLNSCQAVVGAESGTGYLEKDDRTRRAIGRYLKHNPGATFEQVQERFFRHYPAPVSGKAISSRHFEPIGTRTCQLLLEGQYNGILKAGEHYIEIKKDYSNLDDALDQLADVEVRTRMVDRAFEYVRSSHTYAHRVEDLLRAIGI